MSDVAQALGGASFTGFARVEELAPQGMISFRGDLSDPVVQEALRAATGLEMPAQRGIVQAEERALGWMSPDEAILLMPHAALGGVLVELRAALAGQHHLAVDVSDARVTFRLSGPGAREVLAKLAPVDLSPAAFAEGELRRTRVAQVAAAFWLSGAEEIALICFRSVARYVFDLLAVSAAEGGEVRAF